jgi:hypothetical protein
MALEIIERELQLKLLQLEGFFTDLEILPTTLSLDDVGIS